MTARLSRTGTKPKVKDSKEQDFNTNWRSDFLDFLAESSNVSESASKAGVNASRAYKARREEPDFARDWLSALWEGYVHLEMEVLRRLRVGDQQTGDAGKYDFANAIRLLSAHRDNAARAQAAQRNVSAAEVRASIDSKVEAIRQHVRSERQRSGETESRNT